jgi:hypothetical protein
MKTGIQILLTGAIVLVASASFGQNQQANGVQSQKKELIIKGEGKNALYAIVAISIFVSVPLAIFIISPLN